jgi:hypothetical protein
MWPSEPMASRIYDIANAVLLGSLVFGVLSTGLVIWMGNVKEHYSQKELEATRLKAGEANDRAAQADLKRLKLENRIVDIFGPRQLSTEQSARITGKLAGLRGVKIDVYVLAVGNPYTADDFKDSESIGRTVVRTLREAPAFMDAEGWLLQDCHGSGASNVVVSVRLPGSDADRKIATQVLKALQPEIGTDPEISDQSPYCTKFSDLDKSRPNKRKHDAAISVTIGRKISPLLTREMLEPDDKP